MSLRLRSYDATPPGGYPYVQTEGIHRSFPSQPIIEAQARDVSNFRKANGISRSSVREALEDVDKFTCQRLNGHPSFCIDGDAQALAINSTSPILAPPCKGCGAPV